MVMPNFNDLALCHHNAISGQRIYALNKMHAKLNEELDNAQKFLDSSSANNVHSYKVQSIIIAAYNYTQENVQSIKQAISITRRCNYLWVNIQSIVCEDDLRRYYDFMNMSYAQIVKDIVNLSQYIEKKMIEIRDQINNIGSFLMKERKKTYSRRMLSLIINWIN